MSNIIPTEGTAPAAKTRPQFLRGFFSPILYLLASVLAMALANVVHYGVSPLVVILAAVGSLIFFNLNFKYFTGVFVRDVSSSKLLLSYVIARLIGLEIAVISGYAALYEVGNLVLSDSSPKCPPIRLFAGPLDKFVDLICPSIQSFYFSGITMTTTGYGDITPGDSFTRWVAVVEAINGQILFGLFAGILATCLIGSVRESERATLSQQAQTKADGNHRC